MPRPIRHDAEPQAPNDRLQQRLNEVVEEIAQLRQDLIDGDTAITPKGTPRDLSTMDPMTVAMVAYYDRVLAALRELVPACLGMAIAGERLLEAFPEPAKDEGYVLTRREAACLNHAIHQARTAWKVVQMLPPVPPESFV